MKLQIFIPYNGKRTNLCDITKDRFTMNSREHKLHIGYNYITLPERWWLSYL